MKSETTTSDQESGDSGDSFIVRPVITNLVTSVRMFQVRQRTETPATKLSQKNAAGTFLNGLAAAGFFVFEPMMNVVTAHLNQSSLRCKH